MVSGFFMDRVGELVICHQALHLFSRLQQLESDTTVNSCQVFKMDDHSMAHNNLFSKLKGALPALSILP
jgi:hypothetical protein